MKLCFPIPALICIHKLMARFPRLFARPLNFRFLCQIPLVGGHYDVFFFAKRRLKGQRKLLHVNSILNLKNHHRHRNHWRPSWSLALPRHFHQRVHIHFACLSPFHFPLFLILFSGCGPQLTSGAVGEMAWNWHNKKLHRLQFFPCWFINVDNRGSFLAILRFAAFLVACTKNSL